MIKQMCMLGCRLEPFPHMSLVCDYPLVNEAMRISDRDQFQNAASDLLKAGWQLVELTEDEDGNGLALLFTRTLTTEQGQELIGAAFVQARDGE